MPLINFLEVYLKTLQFAVKHLEFRQCVFTSQVIKFLEQPLFC